MVSKHSSLKNATGFITSATTPGTDGAAQDVAGRVGGPSIGAGEAVSAHHKASMKLLVVVGLSKVLLYHHHHQISDCFITRKAQ